MDASTNFHTHLRLEEDWKGTFGTTFDYRISTDLDLPYYLDAWLMAKAEWRAGKRTEAYVEQQFMRARAADHASDEQLVGSADDGRVWSYVTPTR